MSNPVPDVHPDESEVLQHEPAERSIEPVRVSIVGPVPVQPLPKKYGMIRGMNLIQNAPPELLLPADPRRARVQMLARGGLVRIAQSVVDFEHNNYFELVNIAYTVTIEHVGEIWAMTGSASVSVHYIAEFWAE